jgi:hypothetical protein
VCRAHAHDGMAVAGDDAGSRTKGEKARAAGDADRVKKLESVVKRQREVVRDQQTSITALMTHVEELQTTLKAKDSEIAALRQKGAAQSAEGLGGCSPTAASAHAGSPTGALQQEVQKQKQAVIKIQGQLTAALERERVLQQHVVQLQREFRIPAAMGRAVRPQPRTQHAFPPRHAAVGGHVASASR